jgi:endonuclease/exonuclease/phosphatase family metal-dependent hydrolase
MRAATSCLCFFLIASGCGVGLEEGLPTTEPTGAASSSLLVGNHSQIDLRSRVQLGVPRRAIHAVSGLTVMTWNTENFFDDVDDPKKSDTVLTSAEVDAKIAALAKVINSQSPDLLSLQEVENQALLDRLAAAVGMPYSKLVPSYDYRGINVAVVSRLPIVQVVSHQGEKLYAPDGSGPYYWARDCLEVHVQRPDGGELVLLVNHQTSKLDSAKGDEKRQAQATRAREIADGLRAQDPTRPVIIAGDMNDEPTAASTGLYLGGGQFVDIATDVAAADCYTYVYDNDDLRYDYILPDADFASHRTSVTILHNGDVAAASDHSPIVASFTWP